MLCHGIAYFVSNQLVVPLLLCNGAKILVRPCMASDLMTLSDHTRDDGRPCLALIVDCTLVDIDTGDEESGFGIVCF